MKTHAHLQQSISQSKSLQTHHIVCMIRKLEPSIQITAQSCMQELHDHNIEFRSLRTHKAAIVIITFLLIRFAPFKKTCSAVERNQWLHCSMVGASKAVRPQRSAVERNRWLHCCAKIQAPSHRQAASISGLVAPETMPRQVLHPQQDSVFALTHTLNKYSLCYFAM